MQKKKTLSEKLKEWKKNERKLPIPLGVATADQSIYHVAGRRMQIKIDNKNVSFYKSYDFVRDLLQSEQSNRLWIIRVKKKRMSKTGEKKLCIK